MVYGLCFLFAGVAATLQQIAHWRRILGIKDARKRRRYLQTPFYALSGGVVACSAVLGIIAALLLPAQIGLAALLAALIGFSPWATLKSIFPKNVAFGPEEKGDDADAGGNIAPATPRPVSLEQFLNPPQDP